MEDHEERMDSRLLRRLTKFYWISEFRDAFKKYTLTCREAGEIIITRRDLVLNRLDRDATVDPQPVAGQARVYADDARGDRLFEEDEKRYCKLIEGKKKLI